MPNSSGSYSSPKLGAAAIYSTNSSSGSPRPYFAHVPGTMSPYRDASARYSYVGSPRISSLSRDATAALKGSNYPTSSSRPNSPTPRSRSRSPSSSDSGDSSGSSSHGSHHDEQDPDRPLLTQPHSTSREHGPSRRSGQDTNDDPGPSNSGGGPNTDSPRNLKRVHQLQPIDTKSKYLISFRQG